MWITIESWNCLHPQIKPQIQLIKWVILIFNISLLGLLDT